MFTLSLFCDVLNCFLNTTCSPNFVVPGGLQEISVG
jgi:hypothetical protein